MKGLKFLAAGALATVLMVGGVRAAAVNPGDYTDVYNITSSDSMDGATGAATPVSLGNSKNITLDIASEDLKFPGGETPGMDWTAGRESGYAYIGLRINAPKGAKEFTVNGQNLVVSELKDAAGNDLADGTEYVDVYLGFNQAMLEEAAAKGVLAKKVVTISWTATNDEKDSLPRTQTVTVTINPKNVTMKNEAGKDVWTDDSYQDAIKNTVEITVSFASKSNLVDTTKINSSNPVKFRVQKDSVLSKSVLDNAVAEYLTPFGYTVEYYSSKNNSTDEYNYTTKASEDTEVYAYLVKGTMTVTPEEQDPTQEPSEENPGDVVVAPETQGAQTDKNTEDVKSPNTGDNFATLVSMISASAAGLFVTIKKTILG